SEGSGFAAGIRRVDSVRRAENPAAHRHSLYASGTAPRLMYINTVQTPDISSIDVPLPGTPRRTTRNATAAQAAPSTASNSSIGTSVPIRAAARHAAKAVISTADSHARTAPFVPQSAPQVPTPGSR